MTTAPVRPGLTNAGGPAPDWDDLLADIGDRIRAERQARRWSQTALGQRAGLSLATIKRLEGGQSTLRAFAMACAAMHVGIGDVLAGDWRVPVPQPSLTPAQLRVLEAVAVVGHPVLAARRLGVPRDTVTSRLSEIYRRLDVAHFPRGEERRAAAVQAAVRLGLLDQEFRTS